MQEISGIALYQAFYQGAQRVIDVKAKLNQLNVFPVVDSDTGNNLASLMRSLQNSRIDQDATVPMVLGEIAQQSVIGAKGNSGMIFASYLLAVSSNYQSTEDSIRELIDSFARSVQNAVASISNPEEGTILTVMRVWSSTLKEAIEKHDFPAALTKAKESLHSALEATKNHRVMRQYGVVDAGALGFVEFINGITDYFLGKKSVAIKKDESSQFDTEGQLHDHSHEQPDRRYCIEMVIAGPITGSQKSELETLGNSMVVIGNEMKSRIHIHSDDPIKIANVFANTAIEYTKVDDMVLQHHAAHGLHPKIALVTDSIADIDPKVLDNGHIHVLSLPILVAENEYLDKLTIDNDRVFELVDENQTVSSSMVSAPQVSRLFEMLEGHYDSAIIITVAQKLSGTFSLIEKMATEYQGPLKIHVIDSCLNSVAQGALVEVASELIGAGLRVEEVLDIVNEQKKNMDIYVSVSDLKPMIRSGRIPVVLGKILQRLHLKAVVSLDAQGKGSLVGIFFTQGQVVRYIRRQIKKHKNTLNRLHYGYTSKPYGKLYQALKKAEINPEKMIRTSAIIALSAGKDAEAVALTYERGVKQ